VIKEFFELNKIQYNEVRSANGNILTKLVNLIYLLDYTSIYLAVLSKTDPTPVKPIEFIKSRI
jgi:glucose/mannose-6-phosphate isomerase